MLDANKLFFTAAAVIATSCGMAPPETGIAAPSPQENAASAEQPAAVPSPTGAPTGIRLKQFQIVDPQGFGRPVVAASILAPSDWTLEGGVRWTPGYSCPSDMVVTQVRLTSPDGRLGFEIFPNYMSQWSDDPSYNQLVMQAARMGGGTGCPLAPPIDARQFVADVFTPGFRQGAQVVDAQPNRDVAAEAYQQAMAQQNAATGVRLEVDAMRVRIAYGEQEEWIVTTVGRLATPGMGQMGMVYNHVTFTDKVIGFRTPHGELEANEPLFATMLASIRVNPEWKKALDETRRKISEIQHRGAMQASQAAMERSRIISETGNAIREMNAQSWRNQQESQDRTAQQWSQAMRGVDTYTDPSSGSSWEIDSGYNHVWKTAGDEFLLTNDSNFDPNVSLNDGNWTLMQQSQ